MKDAPQGMKDEPHRREMIQLSLADANVMFLVGKPMTFEIRTYDFYPKNTGLLNTEWRACCDKELISSNVGRS